MPPYISPVTLTLSQLKLIFLIEISFDAKAAAQATKQDIHIIIINDLITLYFKFHLSFFIKASFDLLLKSLRYT